MTRITQQKQKFKALGIILKSESQIRTDSVAGTDGFTTLLDYIMIILKSSNLTNRLNVITEYAIPGEHDKVITSLRTAQAKE